MIAPKLPKYNKTRKYSSTDFSPKDLKISILLFRYKQELRTDSSNLPATIKKVLISWVSLTKHLAGLQNTAFSTIT